MGVDRELFGRALDELVEQDGRRFSCCGRPVLLYADDAGLCMPCERPDLYCDQRAFTSPQNGRRAA